MNLKDIVAISGEATLFKFIAQGKNAIVVENLETGRRHSAGATARVNALEEISLFTSGEDILLSRVMDLIWDKEEGGEAPSHKGPDAELKAYFAEVLPEYDRYRVYVSDIKKVLHWYNILHGLNLLFREEENGRAEEGELERGGERTASGTEGEENQQGEMMPDSDKAAEARSDDRKRLSGDSRSSLEE